MSLYELHNIIQNYNGRTVLALDQWSIAENSITGLAGPNGSGKSTLLKLLGFVTSPAGGTILFRGKKISAFSGSIRDEVTLLPQESYLLKRSVASNITYGLKIRKKPYKTSDVIAEALALVGLDADHFAHRPWFALSGGEARRVALAARLVLRPRVLLLDEPNTSVDAASAQSIKKAAVYAHQQWGTSLIIVSHDMSWLQEICHEIFHMFQGKIIGNTSSTLLFGPWEKKEQNRVGMLIDEAQHLFAVQTTADFQNAVASIDPGKLSLHKTSDRISPDSEQLKGVIVSMTLEKGSNRLRTAVQVGNTTFNLFLNSQTVSRDGLIPGTTAYIEYAAKDIRWHTALSSGKV